MRLRELFTDDDAVSPVIGVILMVAITVILAAVIGAFVLGFGGGGPSAPSVQWESSDSGSSVTFSHGGGDDVSNPKDVLSVSSPDNSLVASSPYTWSGISGEVMDTSDSVDASFQNSVSPGDEYNLVWEPEGGDSSQILSTHTA